MDNEAKPKVKKLDESVIVSAVCQRCGDCCRGRFYVPAPSKDQENFHRAIMGSMPGVQLNNNIEKLGTIRVLRGTIPCSKLISEGSGDKRKVACGIYPTRPKICSEFNCFTKCNGLNKHPHNLSKIQKLVQEELGKSVFEEENK